ncbi:MAG: hypothetical protein CMQ40_03820 [Gammaproteobacteria bacterium]|nr:hypothetical protein [Gammaproteobacteria bacterium]
MVRFFLQWALILLSFSIESANVSVTDDLNRTITLEEPPGRIISLAPHLTEILFRLGVGDKIIGTVSFSDYPEEAKLITRLGDSSSVNIEQILAFSPDLIVAWLSGGTFQSSKTLIDRGMVVYVNEPKAIEHVASTFARLGALVGKPEKGNRLSREFLRKISDLRQPSTHARQSVFFQIGDQDLFTVNDKHFVGQAIEICGAENVFADISSQASLVSFESVIRANPDIIILAEPVHEKQSIWSKRWKDLGWAHKLKSLDASEISRPTYRFANGVKKLCALLR